MVEKIPLSIQWKAGFLRIFVCILDNTKKYDFFKNMC